MVIEIVIKFKVESEIGIARPVLIFNSKVALSDQPILHARTNRRESFASRSLMVPRFVFSTAQR